MSSDNRHAIVYDHRNRKPKTSHENIFAITFRELRAKLSPAKLHKSSHRSQQDRLSWCVDVAWLIIGSLGEVCEIFQQSIRLSC